MNMTLEQNIAADEKTAIIVASTGQWKYVFTLLADGVLHRVVWSHWPVNGDDPTKNDVLEMLREIERTAKRLREKIEAML